MLIKYKDKTHASTGKTSIIKFDCLMTNTVGDLLKECYKKMTDLPSNASLSHLTLTFGTVNLSYR